MSLDTIMTMSITVESRAPTQAGFGTPLLFGYHTAWLDRRVKEYATADEMLDDGFTADDALYKATVIAKSQDPSPTVVKIGRREVPLQQQITIEPTITKQGFKYKGLIGGKALSYTVGSSETTTTIANALATAINALAAGTTASNASHAVDVGTVAGPWSLAPADTLKIAIDANVPSSLTTVTFNATAAARECASAETYVLSDGQNLTVAIDGGAPQTVTFHTGNFVSIGAATAEEVAAVINASIIGGSSTATSSGTKVTITSDKLGTGSHVQVTGGTANGALGFVTSAVNGTGNVANILAVTITEVISVITGAVSGCSVDAAPGGYARITSSTTGTSSKVIVDATSTALAKFGFDSATHTGTSGGDTITCTAGSPGVVIAFDLQGGMKVEDITVDTSTDNELPDVNDEDSDWYGLAVIDSLSAATALNSAGWTESQRKINAVQVCSTGSLDNTVLDDPLSGLKDSSYARSFGIYHRAVGGVEWLAVGWLAGILTTTPGNATAAFKTVAGVQQDVLLQSHENAILAKNGSYYDALAGIGATFEGKTGAGSFIDTVRFIDFIFARMRERVAGILLNNPKIPYTDAGVDIMRGAILSVIALGIANGGFAKTPEPTCTAPLVKDVDPSLRANRILPDIAWTATLAGAIHRLNPVKGTVAV